MIPAGKHVKAIVTVKADGAIKAVTGRVRLYVDGRARGTAELQNGRATFKLPRLRAGTHWIRGIYLGTGEAKKSKSNVVRIKVVKR